MTGAAYTNPGTSPMESALDHVRGYENSYDNSDRTGPWMTGEHKTYWDSVPDSALKAPAAVETESRHDRYKDYCTSYILGLNYGINPQKMLKSGDLIHMRSNPARREESDEWIRSWVNWLNDARVGQYGHIY